MVLLIIIPITNGYFIGNIPYFGLLRLHQWRPAELQNGHCPGRVGDMLRCVALGSLQQLWNDLLENSFPNCSLAIWYFGHPVKGCNEIHGIKLHLVHLAQIQQITCGGTGAQTPIQFGILGIFHSSSLRFGEHCIGTAIEGLLRNLIKSRICQFSEAFWLLQHFVSCLQSRNNCAKFFESEGTSKFVTKNFDATGLTRPGGCVVISFLFRFAWILATRSACTGPFEWQRGMTCNLKSDEELWRVMKSYENIFDFYPIWLQAIG